jgi:hypothetical protein
MARDRAERVALTEAAFRIANERMAQWEERRTDGGAASFYCECAVDGCREEIRLTRAEYEAIRADPRRFAVVPGHLIADLETEIESHPGYAVIEKPAALRALLHEADPRTGSRGPARDEASNLADEIAGSPD